MIPPVQLWLGTAESLEHQCFTYLSKIFCKKNGCAACLVCTQIKQNQFHAVKRLVPDKSSYTVSYIDDMMTEISFARDAGDSFFYVFTQAQLLSMATSNRLLKKFEEPTPGYHFILFAESKESLLPTIISRSVIVDHRTMIDIQDHAILEACTQQRLSLTTLAKVIEKDVPNDIQTRIILESLIERLHRLINKPSAEYDIQGLQRRLSVCMHFMHKLPMPGGSKLFWRSLFLHLTQ